MGVLVHQQKYHPNNADNHRAVGGRAVAVHLAVRYHMAAALTGKWILPMLLKENECGTEELLRI